MAGTAVTEATLVELVKTMASLESTTRENLQVNREILAVLKGGVDVEEDAQDEKHETNGKPPANGKSPLPTDGIVGRLMTKLEAKLEGLASMDDAAAEMLLKKLEE